MKRILIVNNNMHIGGVQKALVNLLWCIRERYDITLLLFHKGGECLKDIPPEVKVITADSAYRYLGMTKYDKVSRYQSLMRSFFAGITRIFGRRYAVALMAMGQKKLTGYDAAISYLHNGSDKMFYGGCNEFVLRHVSAKKKITFLHGDYMLCGANTQQNAKQYGRFDAIAACSEGCANKFMQAQPQLAERVMVVPNCHRFENIQAKAEEVSVRLQADKLQIVTVARLGKEKGVERAVQVIGRLGDLKERLHYHIIGDGVQKPLLSQRIKENGLDNIVTLHGMMENPYGYIKAADLLLIPSYSEAAPLVIAEAACLGTPILSTETSSARQMIEKTGFGWVCGNSEMAMEEMLRALLSGSSEIDEKKQYLRSCVQNNQEALSCFDRCIQS